MPDAHDPPKKHRPTMLTTDLALRMDPEYEKISRRFHEDLDEFRLAFAKAWYKLLHRDMGPVARFLGPVGRRAAAVAGPGPGRRGPRAGLRRRRRRPQGQGPRQRAARSSSWSARRGRRRRRFRGTDKRGGANGARIRLEPQRSWEVNEPAELASVLDGARAGPAGVQRRRRRAGLAGRPDRARRLRRGGEGGEGRRPRRDGAVHPGPHRRHPGADRRRVVRGARAAGRRLPQLPPRGREAPAGDAAARPGVHARALGSGDDRAGRRPAGARRQPRRSTHGVLTDRPGRADERLLRQPARARHRVEGLRVGRERLRDPRPRQRRGEVDRDRRRPGLRLELASCAPSPRSTPATTRAAKFVDDFVAAWTKVMELDRFDV